MMPESPNLNGPAGEAQWAPAGAEPLTGEWVDIGYITDTGVGDGVRGEAIAALRSVHPADTPATIIERIRIAPTRYAYGRYVRRATAPPRPPSVPAAPVDAITAAVEGLCACPCRRPLPADGPSAYFATPGCQQNWHAARTTRPGEVLRRNDAAPYPRTDTDRPQLTPAPPPPHRRPDRAGGRRRADTDPVLAFTRHCSRCGSTTQPITVVPGSPDTARQECGTCRAVFGGRSYTAEVFLDADFARLMLNDGVVWASVEVDLGELPAAGYRRRMAVFFAWDHLVRQIVLRHVLHRTAGRRPRYDADDTHNTHGVIGVDRADAAWPVA